MWLDFAEDQAKRRKQIFMKDWGQKLDEFLVVVYLPAQGAAHQEARDPKLNAVKKSPCAFSAGGFLIAAYEHILLANTSPEFIFENTGRPTENVWFLNVEGDGSSLKKARKFGQQYKNDFPELLRMWSKSETEDGCAWLVPAKRIIDNGNNITLSALELIKPETVDYSEPEEILASVVAKEERILELVQEMRVLLEGRQKQ